MKRKMRWNGADTVYISNKHNRKNQWNEKFLFWVDVDSKIIISSGIRASSIWGWFRSACTQIIRNLYSSFNNITGAHKYNFSSFNNSSLCWAWLHLYAHNHLSLKWFRFRWNETKKIYRKCGKYFELNVITSKRAAVRLYREEKIGNDLKDENKLQTICPIEQSQSQIFFLFLPMDVQCGKHAFASNLLLLSWSICRDCSYCCRLSSDTIRETFAIFHFLSLFSNHFDTTTRSILIFFSSSHFGWTQIIKNRLFLVDKKNRLLMNFMRIILQAIRFNDWPLVEWFL